MTLSRPLFSELARMEAGWGGCCCCRYAQGDNAKTLGNLINYLYNEYVLLNCSLKIVWYLLRFNCLVNAAQFPSIIILRSPPPCFQFMVVKTCAKTLDIYNRNPPHAEYA